MSREQALDELEFLATVEHALVVEYLSVSCAFGHDLAAEDGGSTTAEGRNAADAASSLALGQMFRLKRVSFGLIDAGRSAQLGRATSISGDASAPIALDPPSAAQLERLVEREEAIAAAVDQRYARLRPAVTSDPVFEGDLLDELRRIIVDAGPTHAASLAPLRDSLGAHAPADLLRATRREGSDSFERRLLDVSDRSYRLIVAALQQRFVPDSITSASLAVSAMEGLDDVNRLLVQRGLLPPFTAA
jgi:hypothetical protein